jgi:hypothetical protein
VGGSWYFGLRCRRLRTLLRQYFFGGVGWLWKLRFGFLFSLVEVLFEVALKLCAALDDLGKDNSDAIKVLHSRINRSRDIECINTFDSLLNLLKQRITFYLISLSFSSPRISPSRMSARIIKKQSRTFSVCLWITGRILSRSGTHSIYCSISKYMNYPTSN